MNAPDSLAALSLSVKCRTYKASGINWRIVREWFALFPSGSHSAARKFLAHIKYFSAEKVEKSLIKQGKSLMKRLDAAGIRPEEVLVVQIDEPASSSAKAASVFRKNVPGGKKCKYFQFDDKTGLYNYGSLYTPRLIIYVDDFIGTGTQVGDARAQVIESLGVDVPEHILAFAVLKETHDEIQKECPMECEYLHGKEERPLLSECTAFSEQERAQLCQVNLSITAPKPLGFGKTASMIVLGDGVPDNSPALLREALFDKFL